MSHPYSFGKNVRSPGGSFFYEIQGPVCVLYDREELPWPSCSLNWKGKQPSWNRQGKRFVGDMACSRCPAYAVKGMDQWGNEWYQVLVIYQERLNNEQRRWWYSRYTPGKSWPLLPGGNP